MMRVPRAPEERDSVALRNQRRFRCLSTTCNWQGMVPVVRSAHSPDVPWVAKTAAPAPAPVAAPSLLPIREALPSGHATPIRDRLLHWAPTGALLFLGAVVASNALWTHRAGQHDLMRGADGQPVPLGESDYGVALPATHPLLVRASHQGGAAGAGPASAEDEHGLSLRQNCAWGRPGGNPYKGSVEQALNAARLPPDVVKQVAAKVKAGQVSDDLVINNDGIRSQRLGRDYSPRGFAMTYGHTICLNTRVNFRPGHIERAALYEVNDAQGRRHAVMVPEVCGNVSVLSERGRRAPAGVLAAGEMLPANMAYLADEVAGENGRKFALAGGTDNTVPEPGTLPGVLLGLAVLAWRIRRR